MLLMIFPHLMMSRMLLSSSCVLFFLLCLSHEYNCRHLSSVDDLAIDDKAKHLSHSTVKGFGDDPLRVHDDQKLKVTEKGKDQMEIFDSYHHKQTDCGSKSKKDMNQTVKKIKKELVHHHQRQHRSKSITFRVPPKNKRVHQQPGFNLDYSPPKTHPPSHN